MSARKSVAREYRELFGVRLLPWIITLKTSLLNRDVLVFLWSQRPTKRVPGEPRSVVLTVAEIAAGVASSERSIQRSLSELEQEKRIRRIHPGGRGTPSTFYLYEEREAERARRAEAARAFERFVRGAQ